ncbi:Hsp70 family protein [Aliihoeflea sp. PC F10.4]
MSLKKIPFISSVKLARVDESHIIPTALYYEGKKAFAGKEAKDRCPGPEYLIEEFKVALGSTDPDALERRSNVAGNTPRRTPVGLAKDFFDETLRKVDGWLDVNGLTKPTRILIAEPLSLGGDQATEAWLANYRKSIRRLLPSRFVEVDFLPEPFAVFQYYRYGLRHPVVAEQRKQIALVLDFGGGTFDVSVIETTKQGDISQSGVNSRPLGAKSIHIGGFYINRLIAEDALFAVLDKRQDKSAVRKALNDFYDHKNQGEEFVATLSESRQALFRHMKRLLQDVERAKVSVCNAIANWNLDADLSGAVSYPIDVPSDPMSASSTMAGVRLNAAKLREIFEKQVWIPKLRQTISQTLERAKADLRGQTISVVLLSGGSSNLRWLKPLLERDLKLPLQDAQVLELNENFQEIVAKGLATECARRFYTGGRGDFRAVTYNRLCLALRADGGQLEIKKFRPIRTAKASRSSHEDTDEGVLLPAASSLRGLTNQALAWKVRLSAAPKRSIEYFFLRSSFDPEDLDALHNVASTRIFTPLGAKFQQSIEVELTVREDGTAEPKFAYGRDNLNEGTVVAGKPFFMDMTFAAEEENGETYLGLDFGTSTSSCSFIRSDDVQFIEQRARSREWRELADLLQDLPYPTSAPLARYISETDSHRRVERGREAAEALLTFAAYVAYCERSTISSGQAFFKGMAHRSAGPLWALLKNCLRGARSDLIFSAGFSDLIGPGTLEQIDAWVSELAVSKHGKLANIDYVTFLSVLANSVARSLGEAEFGIFEGVTAKRFASGRFTGRFRSLRGQGQPFVHVSEYEGVHAFSEADPMLVHPEKNVGLCLAPLYFWGLDQSEQTDLDLFEYDGAKGIDFSFKAVQLRAEFILKAQGDLREAWEYVGALRQVDQKRDYLEDVEIVVGRSRD